MFPIGKRSNMNPCSSNKKRYYATNYFLINTIIDIYKYILN